MVDRYTKVMLTVIAAALTALTVIQMTPRAHAADGACGSYSDPCYIRMKSLESPLQVKVAN